MEVNLLELYNADMKLGIIVKRTMDKRYKYCTQISPVRNIWDNRTFDNLDIIKKMLLGEIINGYSIKTNLLGMEFIDELLNVDMDKRLHDGDVVV
jgi:hypothetical protein